MQRKNDGRNPPEKYTSLERFARGLQKCQGDGVVRRTKNIDRSNGTDQSMVVDMQMDKDRASLCQLFLQPSAERIKSL